MQLEGRREGAYLWNWKEEGKGAINGTGRRKGRGL